MSSFKQFTYQSTWLLSLLLGGTIFTSCAANEISPGSNRAVPPGTVVADTAVQNTTPTNAQAAKSSVPSSQAKRPAAKLIKKASMMLIVDSVDKSVEKISQIINQQQGDLIRLQEQQPKNESTRHTASIQMRVPANLLDQTLDELEKLGTVKSRNISAEDVGDRLVDIQARLTNLRKTEANLQKIMDRAGSVRDVLSVSQELSNTRQSIEQIDAQLKNLQNQVAYSTINLNLEAAVASNAQGRTLGVQVQETWNTSTNSFGKFMVRLLKLGIWLMVYSPLLLIVAVAVYTFQRRRSNSRRVASASETTQSD
ncbi:DUF4349 domain-containing protein [Calothrix sp. 336/3]|uniref:DUF4349 domain-containing protein n=1 Tax=Calothrix sp. 336/3 TaxID=1337936 RepID=UPI0004E3F9E5|nr:DUF4349 domain-containing protein [Calothrix sp. 336/3]AKG20299.1 hypothetical protein IJ00_02300 [Calothrix sp. 336/3]